MLPILIAARLALSPVPDLTASVLELTFRTFPTHATEAGLHDRDAELEDLSAASRARFLADSKALLTRVDEALRRDLTLDDRLDARVVKRRLERTIHEYGVLRIPEHDPLFWTQIAANATVHLLLREDRPLGERLSSAASRVEAMPRFAAQARQALETTSPQYFASDHCRLAAAQARATAGYFRGSFAEAARGEGAGLRPRMVAAGARAAVALEELASAIDAIGRRASGSPRLGPIDYATRFRLVTGLDEPVADVLARAERALADRRAEAAAYGREVWGPVMGGTPPSDDREVVKRLFARVAEDHAASVDDFVATARSFIAPLEELIHAKRIVTLPDPLTLYVGVSPPYFLGQSVGGVYPAGPYAPDAETLFLLPTPKSDATPEQAQAFFRDFNTHFMRMITAHELLPGHYTQMKRAAHRPSKVRAIFANGVFVEGWGTFCERLMLDAGWGGPLDRLAHLKKRMENAARAVADIRVHTAGMTRDELIRLFRDDALQDEQFAGNAWTRALTSAPQMTTYFLGEDALTKLVAEVKAKKGAAYSERELLDAILDLGPVTVGEIRDAILGGSAP